MSECPDGDLVHQFVKTGNYQSFEKIYQKYIKDVFRFVYSRVGDRHLSEDITSETFLALVDALKSFRFEGNLKAFIFGVAHNKIRQSVYKVKKEQPVADFEDVADDIITDEIEDEDLLVQLTMVLPDILAQLPLNYQKVLKFRFLEEMSAKQTAECMNISEVNVRVTQNRAIKAAQKIANGLNLRINTI